MNSITNCAQGSWCAARRDGIELDYVRARFHLECTAAGVWPIDCTNTWQDLEGLETETLHARRLGYRVTSAVSADHTAILQRILIPSDEELLRAGFTCVAGINGLHGNEPC